MIIGLIIGYLLIAFCVGIGLGYYEYKNSKFSSVEDFVSCNIDSININFLAGTIWPILLVIALITIVAPAIYVKILTFVDQLLNKKDKNNNAIDE